MARWKTQCRSFPITRNVHHLIPKRVIIFSPHPDDDIISMGGTFQRLHDQGHDVHVGYQTIGNIAVTDEFVTRFLDFAVGFEEIVGIDTRKSGKILDECKKISCKKKIKPGRYTGDTCHQRIDPPM